MGDGHQEANERTPLNNNANGQQQPVADVSYRTNESHPSELEDSVSSIVGPLNSSSRRIHDNDNNSNNSRNLRDFLVRTLSKDSLHGSVRYLRDVYAHHTGSIGILGSISIAVNNLTGPAMLEVPATFRRSGIVPTLATLMFVCLLAALCSLHMANVISKVPRNADFQQGIEFPEAFRTFWGPRWFYVSHFLFFACITCLNVSSLVDNAQVVDTFMGNFNPWGGAWALAIQVDHHHDSWRDDGTTNHWLPATNWIHWKASECDEDAMYNGGCVPFSTTAQPILPTSTAATASNPTAMNYLDGENHNGEGGYLLLTAGYVFTALLFLPLALMDLKENVAWQILAFFILIVTSIQFTIQFALVDEWDWEQLTWWGESYDSLLGVVLFNFAIVITVPAWLFEKEPDVDIPTVLHGSCILSVILYVLIGILGCLALPDVSDNMLESMLSGALGSGMQIGASVFAFFIIGLNIPLFSVLTRSSLLGGGNEQAVHHQTDQICSRPVADILSVYFPFLTSWMLYEGSKVTALLSWGGVIFTSLVAFLFPLALSLDVVQKKFDECQGSVRVYSGCLANAISSQASQVLALRILLGFTAFSIVIAIVGNILDMRKDDE